ncbi:glycerol-3-phosphate 1-O-acyltransferase PlsY [Frisingicoccus sp.]|uniref:glycerol-3-phosphate 1-O-acyltransferase PlsY n=1 Tax=Frisingicoccus sp. TaxID=1918627 RepID=UPI002EA7C087|nr:glycerol-3-phosphate 1-O-acyltransferase PlsY [Frisingicoccus sp.]
MVRDIILCLIIGYIFGCFQTGYIYGKCHGIDIRQYGSGNAGTTNTLRVLGKKAGYITYLGDALKAIFAILLVKYVIYGYLLIPSVDFNLLLAYTGLGVAFGHNYPFYLGFKGGKGIATTSGVMLALDLRIGLIGIIGFFILFCITRYVSIGSLYMSLAFPICVLIFYPGQWHLFAVSVIFWLMAWVRHKENIKRLLNGTENRFERKKKN